MSLLAVANLVIFSSVEFYFDSLHQSIGLPTKDVTI